jgi:hypothetical protein
VGESLANLWQNLIGRTTGPMNLRLLLQPAIAIFFGIRAGLRDAREGRKPYLWKLVSMSGSRQGLLKEAWDHVGKVFVIASILDGIYQYIVFHRVDVAGVIIMAVMLALIPYLIFRGFVNRSAFLRAGRKDRTPAWKGNDD